MEFSGEAIGSDLRIRGQVRGQKTPASFDPARNPGTNPQDQRSGFAGNWKPSVDRSTFPNRFVGAGGLLGRAPRRCWKFHSVCLPLYLGRLTIALQGSRVGNFSRFPRSHPVCTLAETFPSATFLFLRILLRRRASCRAIRLIGLIGVPQMLLFSFVRVRSIPYGPYRRCLLQEVSATGVKVYRTESLSALQPRHECGNGGRTD